MNYEQHPISAFYPALTVEAMTKLRALVRTNHQTMPPGILFEGKVLDGWHYYLACQEENIQPRFEAPEITDPLEFVVRRNEGRRHLTTSQRAVIAERMANWKHGTNRYQKKVDVRIRTSSFDKAAKEAAALNKVGRTSVTEVRLVKERGIPEIYKALEDGKLKPYRANEIAKLPKEQQTEALKAALNGDCSIGKRQRGQGQMPKSKQKKETVFQRQERLQKMLTAGRKPGETVGLTREQVDPDFKGSSLEWMDKYGHVQIMTKDQLEADRENTAFSAWLNALRDLILPLQKYLETKPPKPEQFQAWLQKSKLPERRTKRTAQVKEWISLIVRTKESIDWINEEQLRQ